MSIAPKFTKFLVCEVMRLSVVGTREREEVEMGLNCVWLLAFDERCGCNVIALRLQACHLVAVKKVKARCRALRCGIGQVLWLC